MYLPMLHTHKPVDYMHTHTRRYVGMQIDRQIERKIERFIRRQIGG